MERFGVAPDDESLRPAHARVVCDLCPEEMQVGRHLQGERGREQPCERPSRRSLASTQPELVQQQGHEPAATRAGRGEDEHRDASLS
eukprot:3269302-Pleurochrysis_carterae.AAC.1